MPCGDTEVYEFDVDVSTHGHLRRGVTVADRRRVTVLAASYQEATLVACQLAEAVDDAIATNIWWRY